MLRYLFYSTKCVACHKLMTIMESQGLINMFQLQSVDNWNTNEFVKWGVEFVPTILIISNNNGQRQKGIFKKKEAFEWVEHTIANRRQSMIAYAQQNRKQTELIQMKKHVQEGLYDYCQNEAEGMSDQYAYWTEAVEHDIDTAQPKTFLPVLPADQTDKYGIMTIPENKEEKRLRQNKAKRTESEIRELENKARDEQTKVLKTVESIRKEQDAQIKAFVDNDQLNRVLTNEDYH